MAYSLTYSLGNITVNDQTLNTQTSLTIPGYDAAFYGQPVDQNQISLLENFASANVVTGPVNAIPGQLWYDRSTQTMKVNTSGTHTPVWTGLGSGTTYGNANVVTLLNTGVAGNVIPAADVTYNLGSATKRWNDLYLSGNTIYLGNTQLSSGNGTLLVNGFAAITSTGVEDITTTGNIVAGNITATGNSVANNITATGSAALGNIDNITITGGSSDQVLTTDGTGNLSWTTVNTNTVYGINTAATQIDRFDPIYWTVDSQRSMSTCITTYQNGFEARFIARRKNDLCGIIWDSVDFRDHQFCAYNTNTDYTGLTWTFTVDLAATCPVLNEETVAPSLTVEATLPDGTPTVYYIALKNYAGADSNAAVRTATITIDWSTVQAGFDATIPVDASNVSKIFLSGIVSGFDINSSDPLPNPVEGYYRITNSVVTGTGAQLTINKAQVAPHELGMCTSYDDQYNLNPERIINNCLTLGYRGWINHYCGMSTYPTRFWDATVNRFVVPSDGVTPVVNNCCKQWHTSYAQLCKDNKYELIQSVSYEFFSEVALDGQNGQPSWIQRDFFDVPGVTGYTPPSYFFSMCNADAMSYLHRVFVEFADIANSVDIPIYMQVGEPWWWINPNGLPCVYDYSTRLAFNAATGLFMENMGTVIQAKDLTASPFPEMYQFLQTTLGESVQSCRAAVLAAYPTAKVAPLIFLPTILDETSGIMNFINYPIPEYSYPNFDFIMTECYDWIVRGEMNRSYLAIQNPIQDFGYDPSLIQYLSGFVDQTVNPDPANKIPIWRRIIGNTKNNLRYNIQKQYIWAYPQVMSDSITIIDQNDLVVFYIGNTPYEVVRQDTI